VIGRQIVGGVAGVSAMGLFAVGVLWLDHPRPTSGDRLSKVALVERLNTARPIDQRWSVTHAISFRRVMVIDVQTRAPEDARAIAALIVDPVRPLKYDEILIYFRKTTDRTDAVERRVQWTPKDGLIELRLAN